MDGSFSFGSYYQTESVMHALDSRVKLAAALFFIVIALFAESVASCILISVFIVAGFVASKIPLPAIIRSLIPLFVIVLVVMFLNLFIVHSGEVLFQLGFIMISEGSLIRTLVMAARLLFIVCVMDLVTLTTSNYELSEAMESLLKPFARFGLPAHELGMIFGIALRFIPSFANEAQDIYRAQVSRGALLHSAKRKKITFFVSLIVPLFASVFRRAETLSNAMDARCYHGDFGRSHLHVRKIQSSDIFFLLTEGLLFVGVVSCKFLGL